MMTFKIDIRHPFIMTLIQLYKYNHVEYLRATCHNSSTTRIRIGYDVPDA